MADILLVPCLARLKEIKIAVRENIFECLQLLPDQAGIVQVFFFDHRAIGISDQQVIDIIYAADQFAIGGAPVAQLKPVPVFLSRNQRMTSTVH